MWILGRADFLNPKKLCGKGLKEYNSGPVISLPGSTVDLPLRVQLSAGQSESYCWAKNTKQKK